MSDIARRIAGYLTHNPGPGIYSRLERAVEAMPENVRVQELPGLLKRYKEGVPGWELKATDFDSVIAGRDVVPREELLSAVRERSPVYTHKEVVLGGRPQTGRETVWPEDSARPSSAIVIERQRAPSPLGGGVSHGKPQYEDYGQGGKDYTEVLLMQPGAIGRDFGSHWQQRDPLYPEAVAHARYDTHGDALRINELQSDLGIHNRKQREIKPVPSGSDAELIAMKDRRESDAMYIERMRDLGHEVARGDDGGWVVVGSQAGRQLPFPLEDTWADLLIKRLALEAARKGHRAIEVASPRAIADKVGGNIDNYEHFYGKVVPGAIERLGRKMGGLEKHDVADVGGGGWADGPWRQEKREVRSEALSRLPPSAMEWYDRLVYALRSPERGGPMLDRQQRLTRSSLALAEALDATGRQSDSLMPGIMQLAERHAGALDASQISSEIAGKRKITDHAPAIRYIMSDEMRRRLIEQGVGASVLAPLLMQGEE